MNLPIKRPVPEASEKTGNEKRPSSAEAERAVLEKLFASLSRRGIASKFDGIRGEADKTIPEPERYLPVTALPFRFGKGNLNQFI